MVDKLHARIERHGKRGDLILDRPEEANAQTFRMVREARTGLEELIADDAIGAILLRGEGGIFSYGLDLKSLQQEPDQKAVEAERIALHALILDSPKPVIVALEGTCYGAAAALVLSCDLVVTGEGAAICLPEVAIKMLAWINLAVLMLKYGEARALELTLTANEFRGQGLLERGIATEVVPDADVVSRAQKLADRLAGFDGPSLAGTKKLARAIAGTGPAKDYLQKVANLR